MKHTKFSFPLYLKIFAALFLASLFSVALCLFSFSIGLADELEMQTETLEETAEETEPETLYSDGTLTLLPDGTIVEAESTESEDYIDDGIETDVSGNGDSESPDVLPPESETLPPESLPGEGDGPDVPDSQVSDTPLYISADHVYIQPVSDSEPLEVMAVAAGADVVSLPADHVVSYKVRFNGNDYTAVFPVSAADSLSVSDGVLCNVGSSAVTGRLFTDGFDTGSYGDRYVTLNSVLSTSGNNNAYRYGSWSYVTSYYPNTGTGSSSLSSTVTYGNIYVVEEPGAFSSMTDFQVVMTGLILVLALCVFMMFVSGRYRS